MKIDHVKIKELQAVIDYFLTGIKEAVLHGGDILENIDDQCNECRRQINEWNALNMMPKEKEIIGDMEHSYLKAAEKALYKHADDMNQADNRVIVMARVYAYVKRMIREGNDVPGPAADRSDIFCYVDNIMTAMPLAKDYFNAWPYAMITVSDDIVTEIENQRLKNPQLDIFTIQTNDNATKPRKKKR